MPPKKKGIAEPKVDVPNGDAGAGRAVFDNHCGACHAFDGDEKTAAAPILAGLLGRPAGTTGFKYSNAMKKSGITWTDKHLFMFLKAPAKYVPGLKMAFAGLESETDRANLIAYLASQ